MTPTRFPSKSFLKKYSYNEDTPLRVRKAIYQHAVPPIDLAAEVIKLINTRRSLAILDVGCGNGDLLITLRKIRKFRDKMVGIDLSRGMLKSAIKNSKRDNLGIVFRVSDAENLPFPKSSFDIIIAKHVLQHVPNVRKAVAEAYRCLKKGGLFLVVLNSRHSKPKLLNFRKMLRDKFGFQPAKDPDQKLNLENLRPYLKRFSRIQLKKFTNRIILSQPKPYIDYFQTLRYSFIPLPSVKRWHERIKMIEERVKREIEENGKFVERNRLGIYIAQK